MTLEEVFKFARPADQQELVVQEIPMLLQESLIPNKPKRGLGILFS